MNDTPADVELLVMKLLSALELQPYQEVCLMLFYSAMHLQPQSVMAMMMLLLASVSSAGSNDSSLGHPERTVICTESLRLAPLLGLAA